MGQELQVPDSFKGKGMAQAFAGLNAQDDNLSDGIGQSYGVIGYKGKQWSLRVRGQRHNLLTAEGFGTPYLDVIILGQAPTKSKSFYKKYDANTSDGDRPICSSIDGIVPDLDVTAKQSDSCALCPKNVWKTDPQTGRKGRECTDYKRLAVLVLPTQTAPVLGGNPLMEPVFLRVPPDSLNSLAIMGETMAGQGFHYSSYITRITFDPNKAHPCMVFRPLQGLTEGEAPVILDMRKDAAVGRITGGEVTTKAVTSAEPALAAAGTSATGLTAPAATKTPALPSPGAGSSPPATGQVAAAGATQGTVSSGLGAVLHATQPILVPEQSTSPTETVTTGMVSTGFGGATPATQAEAAQTPTAASAATDTGEPEDSDENLDARIASLIRK